MHKQNTGSKMRRSWGYIRVSTVQAAREGESLGVQRELIEAICKLEGLALAGIFVEEGVSASKPLASRPQGAAMLAQLAPGDVVVALRLDRVFRNTQDALATLATFKKLGVALYLRDVGGFVSGDSVGELIFSLMSSVAAFERSRTRERIVEVRSSLRAQNRYLGGDVPFGSRLIEAHGERYLEPDAELLAEVQDLSDRDYSSRMIAGHYAQQGRQVSHHAVARLLRRLRDAV